jgi:hypothetical protein
MKLSLIYLVVTFSLGHWPTPLTAQGSPEPNGSTKSKEALLADVRDTRDGGVAARAAIRVAIEQKDVEVVIAGLTGANYDIRGDSLMALKKFSANQQKRALLIALRDGSLWKIIFGSDSATAQYVYFGHFATALKEFGIDATRDELTDATARNRIIQRLTGVYVPDNP